ncbi:hypothetical protein IWQ62_005878 [Dispira parvispora]|uniref:Uncharacterized protein n=1 Tax=Dispira parvispora TaxID=1520584 RepID=A0A9W8AJJ3_9FUNG|nr:hypothetical protein IWQ62_005878 [Dispira parvispora]
MSHCVDPNLSEEEPLSSVVLDSGLTSPPEEREPQLETLTTILEHIQETLGPSSCHHVPSGNPNFSEFTGQDMEDVNK